MNQHQHGALIFTVLPVQETLTIHSPHENAKMFLPKAPGVCWAHPWKTWEFRFSTGNWFNVMQTINDCWVFMEWRFLWLQIVIIAKLPCLPNQLIPYLPNQQCGRYSTALYINLYIKCFVSVAFVLCVRCFIDRGDALYGLCEMCVWGLNKLPGKTKNQNG